MFQNITLKQYLTYLGGGLLLIGVLVGIGFGCAAFIHEATKERPHFNAGKVIERDFNPAHYYDWTEHRWMGQTCYGTGTNRVCQDQYVWIQHHDYVPDDYDIKIENCQVYHKDGRLWIDKEGNAKCFTKWVDVDQSEYAKTSVGSQWGVAT